MYLGIDAGTSSIKTVLINDEQHIVASASEALELKRPQQGWSEQRPEDWWEATCKTIDTISHSHASDIKQLRGIGLSGQMHGATLLDKQNEIIRPAILWNDVRSGQECKDIEEACPESRTIAGNIAMAGFTAPKLAWLRKHEPENFERIAKVLLPKDYLRFCLSGEYVSDMSDASGTLWLDVGKRQWSDALLSATGLSREHMPTLVEGSEFSGYLHKNLQQRWGITQPVIIAGGGGDNAASACGMGTVSSGNAFISLGTSGVLFVTNQHFLPNTDKAVHAFCHALPNVWHQMGVILSATDSLQWLSSVTGQTVAELSAQVSENITATETIFLPYLGGERTPHNDPHARGAFVGLGHLSTPQSLTQSVMEGVAFAFRDSHEALLETGTDFESALVTGGGARSKAWLTILASVLNRSIEVPENSDVGAALGAARLAICASDNASPVDVCMQPAIKKVVEPNAELVSAYKDSYERFSSLYSKLKR